MTIKEELTDLETKVAKGLKKAHKKMVEFKKFKNTPIIVSDKGKIIELQPEELLKNK